MNLKLNSKQIKIIIIIIAVISLFYFFMHLFNKSPKFPTPTVIVQQPQLQEVVEYITQTGTLVAFNSVDLVARVEGYLDEIKFTDGAFVKKGQELLVIQPDTYLEQLKAAQASVNVQKANYTYTKSEYERQKRMFKQNATSQNNVEIWLAKNQEAEAEIAKAVANETIASINYSYTHIKAPFNGRIGRHLVDLGNLVGNGVATNLATVEQIDPIYAYFNLNELDLIKLRAAAKAQGFKSSDINRIPVYIKLQNETRFRHKGSLNFINTGLNASTGTLEFRALLENHDTTLLPGLFVQVQIPVSQPKKQLTVPNTAVLYDQIGAYLLIVDKQNIVQLKRVELGTAIEERIPVTKGLSAQDKIIISGLQFATPNNPVNPHEQEL